MHEDERERFEDYLELERYIEHSRLQKSVPLPTNLAPQLTGIYKMVKLFQDASPPIADPSPEFSAQLYQRLREEMQATEQENAPAQSPAEAVPSPSVPPESRNEKNRRGLSRRTLFASGTIAASLVAGVAAGATIEHALELESAQNTTNLNPHINGVVWHAVAPIDQ